MADNVAITAGSGTSIATDDAGAGGHVQIVKLAISTDGSATVIPADATNGIDVDVTRVSGGVDSVLDVSSLRDGATALTPKFASIDVATSGDNTAVAAVASKKIRVVSLYLVSAGTVNVRFESGAGGTALSGQMNLVANTGFVLPFNPVGWFETASNTLLNIELSAAVSVDGSLTYVEV